MRHCDIRPCLILCIILCTVFWTGNTLAVIYGEDDRREVRDLDHPTQSIIADSVVVLFDVSDLSCDTEWCNLTSTPPILGEYYELCETERFYGQPTIGWCSGFLVARDEIVTAGHCIDSTSCSSTAFVFDFAVDEDGKIFERFPVDDVYVCDSVLGRVNTNTSDWAIVRVDRPIEGHTILPIRRTGSIESDPEVAALITVGHPNGIPAKISEGPENVGATGIRGCHVMESQPEYFGSNIDSNLDAFGGNSGSAVVSVNLKGELIATEGILVRGFADYIDNGICWESNHCDDAGGCEGGFQDITRITELSHLLDPPCGDGVCDPIENHSTCPEDCLGDGDGDGMEDSEDNCPLHHNPLQEDADMDYVGDPCDCLPDIFEYWSTPGEARNLRLVHDQPSGMTTIEWSAPVKVGGTILTYDTLRSVVPFDFLGPGECIDGDSPDRVSFDNYSPVPDEAFFYLVRARNICPDGEGPLGFDSEGWSRQGVNCP